MSKYSSQNVRSKDLTQVLKVKRRVLSYIGLYHSFNGHDKANYLLKLVTPENKCCKLIFLDKTGIVRLGKYDRSSKCALKLLIERHLS